MGQYLGQHFLSDQGVLDKIVDTIKNYCNITETDNCIEIGPGEGALTRYLMPIFNEKLLFEKDATLKKKLLSVVDNKTTIVWGDVLEQSAIIDKSIPREQQDGFLVVGNLPYYITSPIFTTFFVERTIFPGGVFLIQKEVGEKISTSAKKKSYLWWLVNYYYSVEYCFTVDKSAFTPPPKVQSAVVGFLKRNELPNLSFEKMILFLDIVSQFSRKTLGKIQKMRSDELGEHGFEIPENLCPKRLEQLTRDNLEEIIS